MKCFFVICAVLCAWIVGTGCAGENANSFVNSIYITIKPGGSIDPENAPTRNGYRVVFLNNDSIAHAITFEGPLVLSQVAQPDDRAWFDLPNLPVGTVLHYHLDASGPTGSVTFVPTP